MPAHLSSFNLSASKQNLEANANRLTPPSHKLPLFSQNSARIAISSPLAGFCHPTNGAGYLSQGNNGLTHRGRSAYAYDLAVPIGTPVYAMQSGQVVGLRDRYPDTGGDRSKFSKFNYVMIQHQDGHRSVYMHLQQDFNASVNLHEAKWVTTGELIGYSGNSGWSLGPHLHIEVQTPGSGNNFTKTVPFLVSGRCSSDTIAQN